MRGCTRALTDPELLRCLTFHNGTGEGQPCQSGRGEEEA